MSLVAGLLAYVNALGLGFVGFERESTAMGVVAFLLIGGAVGVGFKHLTRARIAILLADLAIVVMTLTVFGPSLAEAIEQGQWFGYLAGAVEELLIWLAMVGMALAAGFFVTTGRN